MRRALMIAVLALTSLCSAPAARSVVVNMGGAGRFGVALVPGTDRASAGIQSVTSNAPCTDPWLASDLGGPRLPNSGLCYLGGSVVHQNETFDLTWDPMRRDWSSTRNFVEQYLRHVADGNGTLTSPYAVASQYRDGIGRAASSSLYGGGCIDYGSVGGASCRFAGAKGNSPGSDYPASGCPVVGVNQFSSGANGPIYSGPNAVCLTDAEIHSEVAAQVSQEGLVGRTQRGFTPLVVVMTPPGVVDCLDAAGALCSSNGAVVPPLPTASAASSGGNLPPGTYKLLVTYQLPGRESVASAAQTVTVPSGSNGGSGGGSGSGSGPGGTSSQDTGLITIAPPPTVAGATGWYAYVTQAAGSHFYKLSGSAYDFGHPVPVANAPSGTPTNPPVTEGAFCTYHSSVTVGGQAIPYVVQPWTALTGCDDPSAPAIPTNPDPETLAVDIGARLVSPISQATVAAMTDPFLNGWMASDGSEINDNGCGPLPDNLDSATVGGATYLLQRVFNNGGVLESDPNALACAGAVALIPRFVMPSAVDPGDVVEFDGSKTVSTLLVPRAGYAWSFGDGTFATGPSVVHSYAKGGSYTVTLTVSDRGNNVRSLSQQITVLGAKPPGPAGLTAHLQLLLQSLHSVLRSGIAVRIISNLKADGFTTLSISKVAARQAHLRTSRAASVMIGRGTLTGIVPGSTVLRVRIPPATVRMLARLHHLTLTLRLTLVGSGRARETFDVAGRY